MNQRRSNTWESKGGGWELLNNRFAKFDSDYPILSSLLDIHNFRTVVCNNYSQIDESSLVSSFIHDYILERYWNNPDKYIEYFKKAKYVMSPDFSLLVGMPKPAQIWNVYRNRLVGYVWQEAGINVIPTVSWAGESSFEFCFEGVGTGSSVAISNIGCRNEEQKAFFDKGFEKMKEIIQPKVIVFQCNNKYKEFYTDKNIIFIESFWDEKRKSINK
jgi:hypothetical protein